MPVAERTFQPELGWFRLRPRRGHGGHPLHRVVETGHVHRRRGQFVQGGLELGQSPDEDERRENQPRQPGAKDLARRTRDAPGLTRPINARFAPQGPARGVPRLPEPQQDHQRAHRGRPGERIYEPGSMKIRDQELRPRERQPGRQRRRPNAQHPPPAGKGAHHPKGQDQRKKRQLPAHHG